MKIDIFEVPIQLLALVIAKQEQEDIPGRIVAVKSRQLLTHSLSDDFHCIVKDLRPKQP